MAANNDNAKEIPPLPLVSDETEEEDSTKYCTYKLAVAQGSANKYSFTMLKVDGTQSIRATLKWTRDIKTVFKGLEITDGADMHNMVQEMCSGATLTAYNAGVEANLHARWQMDKNTAMRAAAPRDAAAETQVQYATRIQRIIAAVDVPDTDENAVMKGAEAVLTARCPYKVLEKQKRFMRRKMRKPFGMTTRQYVNHLSRINNEELPNLPPFRGGNAGFSDEEFKEIILFGIPNRWKKDMDKFDFDPYSNTIVQLVEFCERMEASDDTANDEKGSSKGNTSPTKKSKSSKTRFDKSSHKKGDKWCDYHESDTHTTAECTVLKKLKASKSGGDSTKKQWKSKSDYAKDKAKKELNALRKKTKKAKLELNAATKTKNKNNKRKSDSSDDEKSDDSSFHSLNMLEASMKDVDEQLNALEFSDTEEGEVL